MANKIELKEQKRLEKENQELKSKNQQNTRFSLNSYSIYLG